MIAKLPYLDAWDVTPCEIVLHCGLGDDGGPEEVGTVFRDIPQPPYKVNDVWHMPELTVDYWLNSGLTVDQVMALGITVDDRMGGNSYVCINSRETGSFTRSDWMITGSTDKMSVVYDARSTAVGRWKGLVNFSEKARRVQDKDGQWVKLAGVIHVKGDILPGVQFTEGTAKIEDFPARKIIGYSRPRNPDGSVNHTRLELI